jgi:hypothetical protein
MEKVIDWDCHNRGMECKYSMFKRPLRLAVVISLLWFFANFVLIIASWGRSYLTPTGSVPQVFALDLRADKSIPGHMVTIIATKQTPSKGDYIGHMWVAWPQTPPLAPAGTKEAGYYAADQLQAALTMAGAIWAPWGFITGHAPVAGHMKVDDGWWRHKQINVTVDEAHYQAALAVDSKWRRETRYGLRPGIKGVGQERTWACQDYVFEVAAALGMKADHRDWTQFPMGSFVDFATANGVVVQR